MTADKNALRREAKRHRERMDVQLEDPDIACQIFFDKIKPQQGQIVSAYWPIGREIDTTPIIERLIDEKIDFALPLVVKGKRELKFALWDGAVPLIRGEYDVYEPNQNESTQYVDPDIMIVPLLAFDRRGHRMGYGGGHFDTTIAALRKKKNITCVGYAYAQQAVIFHLPTEDHDQVMDWVITPKGAHYYKREG